MYYKMKELQSVFLEKKTLGCTMKSVLDQTLNKSEYCIKETLHKVPM